MPKFKSTNIITFTLFVMLCNWANFSFGQKNAREKAESKQEQLRKDREKAISEGNKTVIEKHWSLQGKKTLKRMKANNRLTKKYQKRRIGYGIWKDAEKWLKKKKREWKAKKRQKIKNTKKLKASKKSNDVKKRKNK